MTRIRRLGMVALLFASVLAALVIYQQSRTPDRASAAPLTLQPVASGLSSPVGIVSVGDSRLFIVQQTGAIVVYDGTKILPTAFLDVTSLISCCGERGLLGLAFHPAYASNGLFFIYYTNTSGNLVLARYHASPTANVADATPGTILLTIPHPTYDNHNGGQLQFGTDGKLYIGTGDGGSLAGDPNNNAQSLGSLLGKILRIDVDAGSPYAVPGDNPFVGNASARPEIWAYGLRNPWRFSFDRSTHDLLIGDVGQSAREEVDFQPAGSRGGQNYGWRLMEGTLCFNPSTNCNPGGLTMPILEYAHGTGDCAITGGYRYRGVAYPAARGTYIFGDYCSGRIWGAAPSGGAWQSFLLADTSLFVSSFGEDRDGEIYVADVSGGAIYRLTFPDTDGDGCIDARELGPDWRVGGQRDANNAWDFADVPIPPLSPTLTTGTRNKAITLADAIAELAYVGTSASNPNMPNANGVTYGSDWNANGVQDGREYDRSPSTTSGAPWRSNAPNGAVSIEDVIVVLNQVGTTCA